MRKHAIYHSNEPLFDGLAVVPPSEAETSERSTNTTSLGEVALGGVVEEQQQSFNPEIASVLRPAINHARNAEIARTKSVPTVTHRGGKPVNRGFSY